ELLGLHRGHVRAAGGRERQAQGCGGEHGTAGTAHGGLLFDAAERRGRTVTALTEYPTAGPSGRRGHGRDRDGASRTRRTDRAPLEALPAAPKGPAERAIDQVGAQFIPTPRSYTGERPAAPTQRH